MLREGTQTRKQDGPSYRLQEGVLGREQVRLCRVSGPEIYRLARLASLEWIYCYHTFCDWIMDSNSVGPVPRLLGLLGKCGERAGAAACDGRRRGTAPNLCRACGTAPAHPSTAYRSNPHHTDITLELAPKRVARLVHQMCGQESVKQTQQCTAWAATKPQALM